MPNVIYCDSYSHYATADLGKRYLSVSSYATITAGAGRSAGSSCLRYTPSFTTERTVLTLAANATLCVEAAMRLASTVTEDTPVLLLRDSGGNVQVDLRWTASGDLRVTRNGTSLGNTSGLSLLSNVWHHIGLLVTIHSTTGSFDLRVNGVTQASATGINTQATGIASVSQTALGNLHNFNANDFCDLVISTDTFCGDCAVLAVFPQGAGNYSQWTPSAGSGYQCVDEAVMNGDTDYVSSATAGQRNSYDFAAVAAGAIKAVQQVTTLRKDDAGTRTVKQFARVSGTDYDGAAGSAGDAYGMQRRVMTVNPATGADWTVSGLNSAEFGSKLES